MQKAQSLIFNWSSCFFAILCWSITFVNTRSLLLDFSALEIMVIRFALAWAALCGWAFLKERGSIRWMGRCELLFAAMGFSGAVAYQFLENCAIYYTNASNVAILVSVFLGLCASALAFAFWSKACAELGVVKTTICHYLEPIIAVVFAVLFLGETVSLMSVIGGVLIAVGVYVANRSVRK